MSYEPHFYVQILKFRSGILSNVIHIIKLPDAHGRGWAQARHPRPAHQSGQSGQEPAAGGGLCPGEPSRVALHGDVGGAAVRLQSASLSGQSVRAKSKLRSQTKQCSFILNS